MSIVLLFAGLGLILGSFVNAWVWRLFNDESISTGRSHCPRCNHTLKATDLVPVISWLLLKGRCRYCKEKISKRYPLVELLSSGLYIVIALMFVSGQLSVELFSFLALVIPLLMTIALSDLYHLLIPMVPVGILTAITIVFLFINIPELNINVFGDVMSRITAVVIYAGGFLMLNKLPRRTMMGLGDVYLMVPIALHFGLLQTMFVIMVSSVIGTLIFAVPALIKGSLKSGAQVPFGTLLLIGFFIQSLFGHQIIELVLPGYYLFAL